MNIPRSANVGDLKDLIFEQTNIPPIRQKILNLIKGALPKDDVMLSSLEITPGKALLIMGTPDAEIFKDPSALEGLLPEILEDLEDEIANDVIEKEVEAQRQKELDRVTREVCSVFTDYTRLFK